MRIKHLSPGKAQRAHCGNYNYKGNYQRVYQNEEMMYFLFSLLLAPLAGSTNGPSLLTSKLARTQAGAGGSDARDGPRVCSPLLSGWGLAR